MKEMLRAIVSDGEVKPGHVEIRTLPDHPDKLAVSICTMSYEQTAVIDRPESIKVVDE